MKKSWKRYKQLVKERPESFADTGSLHIIMDEAKVREFEKETGKKIGVIYESAYNILVVDLVYSNDIEKPFAYERILPAVPVGAAACVAFIDGRIIMLKQYRHAPREWQLNIPRGFGEVGITHALDNAMKELSEETGAFTTKMEPIGYMYADTGLTGTRVNCCRRFCL